MTESVGRSSPRGSAIAFLLLVAFALLIYAPWTPQPFNMLDFSEFLPILRRSGSPWDAFVEIARYYRAHGRSNVIQSAFIALNWELFGEHPAGWRWLRTVAMAIPVGSALLLLRRLDVSAGAAAFGAGFLVASRAAGESWLRLTGEPFALAFLTLALLVALDYRDRERWTASAGLLGLTVGLMLLSKETMIVCVPAVLGIAVFTTDRGRITAPENDARTRAAAAIVGGVSLVFLAVAWWIARSSGGDAYVATYGTGALMPGRWVSNVASIVVPLGIGEDQVSEAGVLFAALLLAGIVVALRRRRALPPGRTAFTVVSGYLILAGATVYLPWIRFHFFYGLPFALGTVLMLAFAVEGLERVTGPSKPLVWAAVVFVLAVPAVVMQTTASQVAAAKRASWALAADLSDLAPADTLIAAVSSLPPQDWQGEGATYARIAHIIDPTATVPPAKDMLCEDARDILRSASYRRIVISLVGRCTGFPDPSRSYREEFEYLKVPGHAFARDAVQVDVLVR